MEDTIIKIEHVSKQYRLGAIGGGTLRGDLQSLAARIRGKADPNAKIGQDAYTRNERFLALDDVSFEVRRGERLGIIGHNGAGKSTLLKLLSRVTAPTTGTICYNGRIASMLEVGTGFHPELTGRENVYLNGAILGMTKAEIDRKFDDIVSFAEMEKFIDTPVKRYSSGMYVKLAFAVAAHLDSEIMVMDEVLAVGDMKFQEKCLGKMGDVSDSEGRTILYVSHNMNTIRQLCTRCIVLDHGKIVFDGDVEQAISIYMDSCSELKTDIDLSVLPRSVYLGRNQKCMMQHVRVLTPDTGIVCGSQPLQIELRWKCEADIPSLKVRIEYRSSGHGVAASLSSSSFSCHAGDICTRVFSLDTSQLCPDLYNTVFVLYEETRGASFDRDCIPGISFEKVPDSSELLWNRSAWGSIRLHDTEVLNDVQN